MFHLTLAALSFVCVHSRRLLSQGNSLKISVCSLARSKKQESDVVVHHSAAKDEDFSLRSLQRWKLTYSKLILAFNSPGGHKHNSELILILYPLHVLLNNCLAITNQPVQVKCCWCVSVVSTTSLSCPEERVCSAPVGFVLLWCLQESFQGF